jgi:plastocyanin
MNVPTMRTPTTLGVLAVLLFGSAFFVARGGAREHAAVPASRPAVEITIDNFAFARRQVTVERGTTVTWLNRDDMPHTVVSNDKSFQSGPLDTGDRFSHTFDTAGTFAYFCSLHPRMTGVVVVR